MRRSSLALVVVTLLAAIGMDLLSQAQTQSQPPSPARSRSDEMLDRWNDIGNKLVAMAKDFPEDKYDFKVQKDQRTFGQNLVHVAAVDYDIASRVAGTHVGPDFGKDKHNPPPDMYKTKVDVVKLLRRRGGRRREGDPRARRRGTGQDAALWVGNWKACGPQFLHLAERHRAQQRTFRPVVGVLPRKQSGAAGIAPAIRLSHRCSPSILVLHLGRP